ncbi:MAG: hypothetical protein RL301_567 [Actinomycetota bacterium]
MAAAGKKVLIVEDEPLIASLLATAIQAAGFQTETASNANEAKKLIDHFQPQLLLTDISLGDGPSGIHLVHAVQKSNPEIAILILTKYADAIRASADGLNIPENVGFLRKHLVTDKDYLIEAIDKVLENKPSEVRHDAQVRNTMHELDSVERKILHLLAQGYNNAEIAFRSNLSVKSIERRIERIYKSLNVSSKGILNPRIEASRIYFNEFGISERNSH